MVQLGLALIAGLAVAQTAPPTTDPAQLQRQREELERQRQQRPAAPTDPKLTAPKPEPEGAVPAGPSFVLRKVEFTPSRLLTPEQLDAVVASQLGKPTTYADVRALAQRINVLYFERGHITARAFVPSQKVADGVLQVRLVEAQLARIDRPENSRLSDDFLASLIGTPVGELIVVPEINDRLERLHRNTDTRVALNFVPADTKTAGQSVIKVQVEEPPFWTARASLSNEGADSLGREQLSINAALNNLWGRTDRLSLLAIGSKGSLSANLQYSLPLPGPFMRWGTRFTGGLSHGKTQAVSPGFETIKLDGNSDSYTLALAQPVWSHGVWSVDGGLSFNSSRSVTDIAAERFSNVRTDSTGLSVTGARVSEGSSLSATLTAVSAKATAVGVPARRATVKQLNLNGQQLVAEGWWLQGRASAQTSGEIQLPTALQFQIGGPGNVRGYTSPTASGDQGHTASLELHHLFAERYDAYVFADEGSTRTENAATTKLASAGLGLNWTSERWSVSAAIASPQRIVLGQDKSNKFLLRLSADLEKLWP